MKAIAAVTLFALFAVCAKAQERHRGIYRGVPVEYEVRNALAITEGDIVLGNPEDLEARPSARVAPSAFGVGNASRFWPLGSSGAHEIPYVFSGTAKRALVDEAIASFNQTFAGVLVWVPRTSQPDYVEIDATTPGCSSFVGRNGGKQALTAGTCNLIGAALHEMGHTAGLWHMQQDPTSGPFIERILDPRDTNSSSRFFMGVASIDGYDYGSLMHYNGLARTANGDLLYLRTIPFGMDIGQSKEYSKADIDAIRRMHGAANSSITLETNPPGLRVLVDGVEVATPYVVQWPIGSIHRLDVPAGIQAMGPFSFGFGRWSHDASANPASSQLYLVEPGDGTPWQPADKPKHGVLVANFVRLIRVVLSAQGPGQWSWTAERGPWPGTSDRYPQWTRFDVVGTAAPGYLTQWLFSGFYFTAESVGETARASVRLNGEASYRIFDKDSTAVQSLGPNFMSFSGVVLQASDPTVPASVKVWEASGPNTSPSWALPLLVKPGFGNAGAPAFTTSSVLAVQGGWQVWQASQSMQFAYKGTAGLDDPVAGTVAMPASGIKTVTLDYERQFSPFVEARPACGGTVSLSDPRQWIPAGKPLTVTATPASGAVFAGWTGSVSGSNTTVVEPATGFPKLVAHFNAIPEILALHSITPTEFMTGTGPVTFTLKGSGFTPQALVSLGELGVRGKTQYVDSRTINLTLTDMDVGPAGMLAVYILQSIGNCSGLVSDPAALKVRVAGPKPGNATVVANPYGAITVQGATLAGVAMSGFAQNSVIQLGSGAGAAGSAAQIDFQGLNVGAGTSLTIRSGAAGQEVFLRDLAQTPTLIAGRLQIEGNNGAPPPKVYLHNPAGVVVFAGGVVRAASAVTIDTLGATVLEGGRIVNQGEIDGGGNLTLLAGQVTGGGALRGNAIVLSTFGNANNPANGSHFLSNGLQLFPSSGNDVALDLSHYGTAPQIVNLNVNGNALVQMPSAWAGNSTLPPNNATVPAGGARPPGTAAPSFGGGSIIVQSTGSMKLLGGASGDLVFPGGIVLRAGGTLDINGVVVNQGWTTSGRAFQGIFLESPNIVSASRIYLLSNDLNWTNFSTLPKAKVSVSTLVQMPDGSEAYAPADGVVTHVNSYSLITEAAANGECWICLLNPTPVILN